MSSPVVSIIVPCYNYGHFLPDTLACVEQQTYKGFECIVVDDGSTDNTREIAVSMSRRDNRFKYVHQSNQGLSAARNTGIAKSSGQWLQLLDADDLIHTQKIQLQIASIESQKSTDIVFSDFAYFTSDKLEDAQKRTAAPLSGSPTVSKKVSSEEAIEHMTSSNLMVVNAPLVSLDFIRRNSLTFDVRLRSLEDWHFWFRSVLRGATIINERFSVPLAFVRKHGQSMSRHAERMLQSHKAMMDSINAESPNLSERFNQNSRHFRGSIIFDELQHGSFTKGLRLAFGECLSRPSQLSWYLGNVAYSIKKRITTA